MTSWRDPITNQGCKARRWGKGEQQQQQQQQRSGRLHACMHACASKPQGTHRTYPHLSAKPRAVWAWVWVWAEETRAGP